MDKTPNKPNYVHTFVSMLVGLESNAAARAKGYPNWLCLCIALGLQMLTIYILSRLPSQPKDGG